MRLASVLPAESRRHHGAEASAVTPAREAREMGFSRDISLEPGGPGGRRPPGYSKVNVDLAGLGLGRVQRPLVKSGTMTGWLPRAMEFSEREVMLSQAAVS